MSKFKTAGEQAREDIARAELSEPGWVENKKRSLNSREAWHNRWVRNPNQVEAKKIEYKEPAPAENKRIFLDTTASKDWQYNHRVRGHLTGKAGEQIVYNPKSTRALTDEEAVICRIERSSTSVRKLAIRFGVSEKCVQRCINGDTYKHLNKIVKPRY